jgi:hypothetical protein
VMALQMTVTPSAPPEAKTASPACLKTRGAALKVLRQLICQQLLRVRQLCGRTTPGVLFPASRMQERAHLSSGLHTSGCQPVIC